MEAKSEAKSQWQAIAVITLLSMGTMYGAARLLEYTQRNKNINESIVFIEKENLFGTIFKFYPEAKERLRAELNVIYQSNRDVRNRAETSSRALAREYLEKSLPLASNESLAELLSWNATSIARLQNDPAACLEFYLGRRKPDGVTREERERATRREGDLKAAVIASSKETPSPAIPYASTGEAMSVLAERYARVQQDPASAAKLEKVDELPPEEGCKVVRAFSMAIAEGPPAETARLYKHFVPIARSAQLGSSP